MKIAIIGYGKMGHMIEDVALARGHEITCVIDKTQAPTNSSSPRPPLKGGDKGEKRERKILSPEEGFNSEAFRRADVAIEFTTPATAEDNILRAWAQGVPVVCGTTGWNLAFGNKIAKVHTAPLNEQATCASALPKNWKFSGTPNKRIVTDENGKTMLVWSSNYSVGVNIFFELNKFLAGQMGHLSPTLSQGEGEKSGGYTPRIKEIHHIHKLDKPSGTAKTLAEQITNLSPTLSKGEGEKGGGYTPSIKEQGKETVVPIESIREGEVPGTHEVTWDSEEDTIVITHIAKGRRGFALGAVLAAEKIIIDARRGN